MRVLRLLPLLLALSACQLFGISQPLTLDQQVASAYTVHTAVVTAAATALTNHTISSAQAQKVADMAATSRALLDEAKSLETAGNTAGATNELALATAALTALQTYVNSQTGAKSP